MWLAYTSKLVERMKVAMGDRRNFSGGETSTFCLSFFQRRHFANQVALLKMPPWKHALHLHLFWNLFQVQLHTNLPQRCTFCHLLQILLNWCISTQLSLMNLNYQWIRLRFSHLSVPVEQNSLLKSFVRIVFYPSPITNAFSFHKLPNIHF